MHDIHETLLNELLLSSSSIIVQDKLFRKTIRKIEKYHQIRINGMNFIINFSLGEISYHLQWAGHPTQ